MGAAALAAALAGCRPLPVTPPAPGGGFIEVACCAVRGAPVEVTYLGVGGWLVRRGGTAILFAPLFSNPGLLRTGLGTIEADTLRIDRALDSLGVDLSDVSLVLSGHGHYDHLMDVPRVMERHAPRARLLANGTSAHQLAPWGLGGRVTAVDDSAGDQRAAGHWITVGDVRVMPFRSVHSPHFEGYTFYQGRRDRDLAEPPRTALEWLDGETVSYLVDFLEGGNVVFRMFYQDAVAAEPFGLVTDSLLRGPGGRAVDLAVLVPSTFSGVPWHPEATVDNVRPRHVMLGHWEDFFRPPTDEPEPLFMNDFHQFVGRLERALEAVKDSASGATPSPAPAGWHMPLAGARFRIR